MKEKQLIKKINDLLVGIHHQSMTNASINHTGTPDQYYDSEHSPYDLWIEYKQLKSMPRTGIAIGDYSDRQRTWLNRRGYNAWGIVGLPNGTAVIQHTEELRTNGSPVSAGLTYKQIATIIDVAVKYGMLNWLKENEICAPPIPDVKQSPKSSQKKSKISKQTAVKSKS